MTVVARGTHRARIYRSGQNVQHDLNLVRNLVDVYGADVWATVKSTDGEIIDMSPGVQVARRIEMWVTVDYDLDIGYLVELKRTMVLDGARTVVQQALTSMVTAGSTLMPVAQTTGFRSGDDVVISDGTTWEQSKVQSVGPTVLGLYADCALKAGYSAGSIIRASRMWRVVDIPIPDDVGPYRVAVLQHVAHALAVT